MTRLAGALQSARLFSRGSAALVVIAGLSTIAGLCPLAPGTGAAFAAPDAPAAPKDEEKPSGGNDQLDAAMQAIEKAFKERNPGTILPLVSAGGKVFLSLHSLGKETGYFGRDQVYFILERIFREHRTTGFVIQVQASRRQSQALCTSHWVFRTNDGHGREVQIFFVFTAKSGQWSLVQIREAA